jgi:hypothetical protein
MEKHLIKLQNFYLHFNYLQLKIFTFIKFNKLNALRSGLI